MSSTYNINLNGTSMPFAASFMDDTMHTTAEANLADRSEFVLHGIQEKPKAAILSVKHKRHIEPPVGRDTKNRIFGENVSPDVDQVDGDVKGKKDAAAEPMGPPKQLPPSAPKAKGPASRNPILGSDQADTTRRVMGDHWNRRNASSFELGPGNSPMPMARGSTRKY